MSNSVTLVMDSAKLLHAHIKPIQVSIGTAQEKEMPD